MTIKLQSLLLLLGVDSMPFNCSPSYLREPRFLKLILILRCAFLKQEMLVSVHYNKVNMKLYYYTGLDLAKDTFIIHLKDSNWSKESVMHMHLQCVPVTSSIFFNTLRPNQNGHHFTDEIFICLFMTELISVPDRNFIVNCPYRSKLSFVTISSDNG